MKNSLNIPIIIFLVTLGAFLILDATWHQKKQQEVVLQPTLVRPAEPAKDAFAWWHCGKMPPPYKSALINAEVLPPVTDSKTAVVTLVCY